MAAKPLTVGDSVKYFSQSHNRWIDCTVDQVRPTGEVQLSCKPGYWMPPAEQASKLQIGSSSAGVPDGGRGAPAGGPQRDAAPLEGEGPASSSRQPEQRRSTFSHDILPEQRERIRSILESQASLRAEAAKEFRRIDADRDGLVRAPELRNCLSMLNRELGIPEPHPSQIDALVRKFDTDGDGALMAEEFQHFFEQVLLRSRRSFVQWKAHYEFFVEKKEGDPWSVHESIKQLGEGSFGVTHLVRDRRSQQTRVLKAVNKAASNMSPQELEQEIKGLKMLDHPHVVKLFEYYEDQEHIFLLMEEARGGELAAVIREQQRAGSRVSERWAATVMTQVLKAIAYCHGRRLMHKDLKSENIMLLRSVEGGAFPHAVIIDLGMAEMFGSSGGAPDGTRSIAPASGRPTKDAEQLLYHRIRSRHAGGTPYTMAPEVWMAYQGTGTFGMKCDVYSLGVVLFQLLTGDFPFLVPAIDPSQWLARIARGPAAEPLAPCSPQAQGLARWMLASEAERPTAREALGHEWFALKAQEAVVQLSEQLRKALCEFSGKNEFQKAVLLQAASQMRAVDLPKVNATFCTCDTDCNGYLTREQLLGALRAAGADEPSAQRAATAIDLDKNGRIEYTEFVAACLALHSDRLEAFLWQIFQKLDSNGSATLTRVEIEQFLRDSELRGLGFAPSGTEIQQIVNELDRDRNGHVKFSAFRDYIIPRGPAPRNFTC